MANPAVSALHQPNASPPTGQPNILGPAVSAPIYVPIVLQQPPPAKQEAHSEIADAASLVDAISHLSFTIIAIAVLVIFRSDIRALLAKITSLELFGQKAEFKENIKKLETQSEGLEEKIETLVDAAPGPAATSAADEPEAKSSDGPGQAAANRENQTPQQPEQERPPQRPDATGATYSLGLDAEAISRPELSPRVNRNALLAILKGWNVEPKSILEDHLVNYPDKTFSEWQLLRNAKSAPAGTMLYLSREIERELRRALARVGVLRGTSTIKQGFNELAQYGLLTEMLPTVDLFNQVRNAVVHEKVEPSESQIASAIDSGMKILKALQNLPAAKHMITTANIPLYSDPQCEHLRDDVVGVYVTDVVGGSRVVGIHGLATRNREYQVGTEVTMEFDASTSIDDSYYRTKDGNIARFFKQSTLFVGRDINSII